MAAVYHTSVTATVTFDEYLSPIGRVRDVLRHIATQTGTNDIKITNRELAELAQCSAGSIPGILRTLEADGHIERIATRQGSLVYLCPPSPVRSAAEPVAQPRYAADRPPEHDQHVDRSDRPIPQQSQGSDFDRPQERDQKLIPPHTPLYGKHDLKQQQQQRAVGASYVLPHQDAATQRLLSLGVWPETAKRIRAEQPDLTVAAIEAAWRSAQGRRGVDPVALLTHCLITGQPIYSQEELHERRTANRRAAGDGAHQPKRPAGGGAGGRRPAERPAAKPKPAVDYDAFLRDNLELPVRR